MDRRTSGQLGGASPRRAITSVIAHVEGHPAGFVTGVEVTHPDEGTEMFLYELGVEGRFRRTGVARGLLRALEDLARGSGCHGMWVVTDETNIAASATYQLLVPRLRGSGGAQLNVLRACRRASRPRRSGLYGRRACS